MLPWICQVLESGDLQESHHTAYDKFHRIAALDQRIAGLTCQNDYLDHCFCVFLQVADRLWLCFSWIVKLSRDDISRGPSVLCNVSLCHLTAVEFLGNSDWAKWIQLITVILKWCQRVWCHSRLSSLSLTIGKQIIVLQDSRGPSAVSRLHVASDICNL